MTDSRIRLNFKACSTRNVEDPRRVSVLFLTDLGRSKETLLAGPDSKLCLAPLKGYDIPFSLRFALNQGKLDEKLLGLLESEVTMSMPQYAQKFSTLLHIEEHQMQVDIRHYDMEDATLVPDGQRRGLLALKVPGLAEGRPSVIKGDHILVRMKDSEGGLEKKAYQGFVHFVQLNDVLLKFSPKFHEKYVRGMRINVRFTFTRTPLKLMHRALEIGCKMMDENKLKSLNLTIGTHLGLLMDASQNLRFYDAKLHDNEEQEQAIKNIVAGTSRPIPYLVFGPPGTGKTVTIVEAIKQILKLFPKSCVLACAPSNSACDLVLQRVMKHTVVPKSQMFRLNALGRSLLFLPKDLRDVSCISGNEFYFPSKQEIMEKRLVVCTLITAGRLVSSGIPDQHFTHVFIDEAGQALQPECVVPLAGMFSTETKEGGQLVLAGDPQQLGPVLRSPVAIKYGLGMSLLEWMMTKIPFYGRIPQDEEDELGDYNPKIITKLLKNYRSHPSILELPNEMFYDDELESCADRVQERISGIKGRDMREEKSPSFFNPEEAALVVQYVKDLTTARGINVRPPEIGVISPYRKQVQKITALLKKANITDLKVGSVEEFQGQERRVIIISTVRSSSEFLQVDAQFKLGFLKNPKRFNVAITRAQALLIVVGNPHVLCKDQHWNRFIKFCKDSKGYRGCEFNPAADDEEEDLMNRLKRVHLDSKEALQTVELSADETVTQVAEQPAWRRGEDY
ncbi:putative helicase mov-10-B.1 [Acropora cervicornis]|uniref:RNA helicase n=1 Tax=Acropora cervicornis TaxID=6130 RepID=A0AAD9UUZ2_ACRCE|nr:putative helicase mov-10-B.1 [Acropora cervicornis]